MEPLTTGTIVRSRTAPWVIALVILTNHCASILLRLTRLGVCLDSI